MRNNRAKKILVGLFEVYSAIFIFSSINREFLLFGLDLRFIVLIFGILLLLLSKNIKTDRDKTPESKSMYGVYVVIILFYTWSLLSNVSWLWNGYNIKIDQMIIQNILLYNNLLAILVYKRFRDYVDAEKMRRMIIVSCCVLVVSFILTGLGLSLEQISGSPKVRSSSISNDVLNQKNIFGGDFRLAGYAEDANYASLFLVMGLVAALRARYKKLLKIALSAVFAIAFGFACSKTILVSMPFCLMCGLLYKYKLIDKKSTAVFSRVLVAIIAMLVIIMPKMELLSNTNTMSTRFKLWAIAEESFVKSPIIGNGISSVRSAINEHYHNDWYVQSHSTQWQILSETGAIGMALFLILLYRRLTIRESALTKSLMLSTVFLSMTYEIAQLQLFSIIFYSMPLGENKESNR